MGDHAVALKLCEICHAQYVPSSNRVCGDCRRGSPGILLGTSQVIPSVIPPRIRHADDEIEETVESPAPVPAPTAAKPIHCRKCGNTDPAQFYPSDLESIRKSLICRDCKMERQREIRAANKAGRKVKRNVTIKPYHCIGCGTEDPDKFYRGEKGTCKACKLKRTQDRTGRTPKPELMIHHCLTCGETDPAKFGKDGRKSKCVRCCGKETMERRRAKRMAENIKYDEDERKDRITSMVDKTFPENIPPSCLQDVDYRYLLTINFTEEQDLHQTLVDMAKKERRTLDQQVLWLVERGLQAVVQK